MVIDISKFRRNSIIVLFVQVILIAVFNVIVFLNQPSNKDRLYRVEINRIQQALTEGKQVNADDYETIIKIVPYDNNYQTNNDYAVINSNDQLYSLKYKVGNNGYTSVIFMNIGLGTMLLLIAGVLFYNDLRVIKPSIHLAIAQLNLLKAILLNQ